MFVVSAPSVVSDLTKGFFKTSALCATICLVAALQRGNVISADAFNMVSSSLRFCAL